MTRATQRAFVPEPDIHYPTTDGKRKPLTYLIEALDYYFQNERHVYVSGDLLIYYEKNHPQKSVAPDVFVVLGIPKRNRDIYQTWVEGKAPDVVIEIASPTTYHKDEQIKPELYQRLGVKEYFQYDPTGDYLPLPLSGRKLDDQGQYQTLATQTLTDGTLIIASDILRLELRLEDDELRVFDPNTKEYLLTYYEEADARRLAEKQAMLERKRKEWAQREALLERQKAEQAQQQAEQEHQRSQKLAEQLRALGFNPDDICE